MSQTLLGIETAIGALGRGANSGPVSIGSVTLTGTEVPSVYRRGGGVQIVTHKLPGGDRVINLFGGDPDRRQLSGLMSGPSAVNRAKLLEGIRDAGQPVTFSAATWSEQVVVVTVSLDYQQRGAVIPFQIEMEVVPQLATSQPTDGTSALSSLIGSDAASALTSLTTGLANAASYVTTTIGQVQNVVGEVTPVASLIGAGGALAGVSDDLTAATALSGSAVNLAGAPSTLSSFVTEMQGAGAGLMSTISSAGGSLTGIASTAANGIASDAPSLQDAAAQAGVLATATQAGGYVNRSLAGASLVPVVPVVHS